MTLLSLLLACNDYGINEEPVVPLPDVAVLPVPVDDEVCAGGTIEVSVLNEGDADLRVIDLGVDGDAWTLDEAELPFEIAPGGAYTVTLTGDGGDATFVVTSNDPDEAVVETPIGAIGNVPPTAVIVSPAEEEVIPMEGDLTFVAFVGDDDDAVESLTLEWISSLAGSLGNTTPDADGRAEFVWAEADRVGGPQFMYLAVTDPCGLETRGLSWYCQDGPYEVYPIVEEAWHYEGAARMDDEVITLTDATVDTVGAAFDLSTIFDGDYLDLGFEFQIEGGTGGEGLSVTLLDAYERDGFVGGDGCGLGFGGGADCTSGPALPGWSLAVDTQADEGGCLHAPHVAFTIDGDVAGFGPCAAIPAVDDGEWHTLHLRLAEGVLTVSLDGDSVLDEAIVGDLDFQGYIGFTASTTDATNAHRVREVEVIDYTCE